MTLLPPDFQSSVPDPGDILTPEPNQYIYERMVGMQIGRLIYFEDANAFAGEQVGFMLSNQTRPLIWAVPVPEEVEGARFPVILLPTWFEAQRIITARMLKQVSQDRHRTGEAAPDELQRRVEGEIIVAWTSPAEPNRWGGQKVRFLLSSSVELHVDAAPAGDRDGVSYTAVCELALRGGTHTVYFLPIRRGGRT